MKNWIFVPARGGSQTIPMKNLHTLGGKPLISWVLEVACATPRELCQRIVVSTDASEISSHAMKVASSDGRLTIAPRPKALADGQTYPIAHVVLNYIEGQKQQPDYITLLQPTSPFVIVHDIRNCINLLEKDASLLSAQTVIPVPHNSHWMNQRQIVEDTVNFAFPEMRKEHYNKHKKPPAYLFGNCVVTRTEHLIHSLGVFAVPSGYVLMDDPLRGMDLDSYIEFYTANALLKKGWRP